MGLCNTEDVKITKSSNFLIEKQQLFTKNYILNINCTNFKSKLLL